MKRLPGRWMLRLSLIALVSAAPCRAACAGPLREWLAEHPLGR